MTCIISNKRSAEIELMRVDFERFISSSPYEKNIARFPNNSTSAWPGHYKDLSVQLAFDAWVESAYKNTQNQNFISNTSLLLAGMDQAWPMRECVRKLIEAAGILLDNKNYDGTGHELISEARKQAGKYLSQQIGSEELQYLFLDQRWSKESEFFNHEALNKIHKMNE